MSDTALNFWFNAALAVVILGVILEGAEFIEEARKDGLQLRNGLKLAAKLGFLLLVLGLGGEWYFSSEMHARDVHSLKTATDRLAAAEIHLTDRHIDIDQVAMLAPNDLAPYAGQKLVIEYMPDDGEGEALAENLRDVLRSNIAGYWKVTLKQFFRPEVPSNVVRDPIPAGIIGPFSSGPVAPQAATGLLDILAASNLCMTPANLQAWADPDPTALTLLISHKDRTSKEDCL